MIAVAFGGAAFGEYISGYLIEKSLSVDNVFVWSMLFATLSIPVKYQHRVLFWGIFGALILRAVFILLGTALIARFWWLLLVFGVFLVYTGAEDHPAPRRRGRGRRRHAGLGLLRRIMPGHRRARRPEVLHPKVNGERAATPLLAALVVVEITDVIFAVDSVPAILAVSNEPFLVFASNAFAILGLRAMYFLLANAKERFHYLSHALGGILIFVGLKMTVSHWYHLNTYISLAIIVTMLAAAIVLSLQRTQATSVNAIVRNPDARAFTGVGLQERGRTDLGQRDGGRASAAFSLHIARRSSAGRWPQASSMTAWVSGQVPSPWG